MDKSQKINVLCAVCGGIIISVYGAVRAVAELLPEQVDAAFHGPVGLVSLSPLCIVAFGIGAYLGWQTGEVYSLVCQRKPELAARRAMRAGGLMLAGILLIPLVIASREFFHQPLKMLDDMVKLSWPAMVWAIDLIAWGLWLRYGKRDTIFRAIPVEREEG